MKRISTCALFFVAAGFFTAAPADLPENSGAVSRGNYQGASVDMDTDSGLLSVLGVDINSESNGSCCWVTELIPEVRCGPPHMLAGPVT